MCAVLAFLVSQRRDDLRWSALAGVLAGVESQFRPNLVLVPLLLVGYLAVFGRRPRWAWHAGALVGCAALVLTPWIVRNYRLTRMVVPTSVHGGVQLWYGTLQVGPYLNSRAYNPRSIFESPVFEYTSLDHVPLIVTAPAGVRHPGAAASDARLLERSRRHAPDVARTTRGRHSDVRGARAAGARGVLLLPHRRLDAGRRAPPPDDARHWRRHAVCVLRQRRSPGRSRPARRSGRHLRPDSDDAPSRLGRAAAVCRSSGVGRNRRSAHRRAGRGARTDASRARTPASCRPGVTTIARRD